MLPLPKECGAAFRIPMLHLPDKSPCLVAQRPFRPGIGDDLIASRQLALLRPLEAVSDQPRTYSRRRQRSPCSQEIPTT